MSFRFFILALLDLFLPCGRRGNRLRGEVAMPMFRHCKGNLKFKKNVYFASPERVTLGKNVWFSNNVTLGAGDIILEDEVMFGPNVCVHAQNHTPISGSYRWGTPIDDPVIIRKGTWCGANSTILAGADIGEGSIVAANAVVTRGKYPPFSLLAGVPAAIKKQIPAEDKGEKNTI